MLQNYIQSFYLNIERNISIMVLKNGLKKIFFDDYSGFLSKTTHPRHGGSVIQLHFIIPSSMCNAILDRSSSRNKGVFSVTRRMLWSDKI